MNNVRVDLSNKSGGATFTVRPSSLTTAAVGSYSVSTVATETTAPVQVTDLYGTSANLGTLNPGQVRAVWIRCVLVAKEPAIADQVGIFVSADEVIPVT